MQAVTEDLGSTSGHVPPRFRPVPGLLRPPWCRGIEHQANGDSDFREFGVLSAMVSQTWDEDLLSWPFDAILCH